MTKSRDAFRTISEVADWLDTPAHVLRFWESKFPQIKPVKRAGGRRYYRPEDMALLGGIKTVLHEDGLTIKGAQKLLREKGVRHVSSLGPSPIDGDDDIREPIEGHLSDLEADTAPATPVDTPDTAEAIPEEQALPAFLRRSPGMSAPVSRSPAAALEAAAGPMESVPEAATSDASENDVDATAPQDDLQYMESDTTGSDGAAPGEPSGDAPASDTVATDASAHEPASTDPHAKDSALRPQPAIPETADLLATRAPQDTPEPKEPRVIHETHDPGSELQPELPFGSLRPAPKPAKRPASAAIALVLEEAETAARPGLLSLLAGAERFAADPARLATTLARLEALRGRPGP